MQLSPRVMRRGFVRAAGLAILLGLAACGVRGAPEPPPDADPAEVREPGARPPPPREGERPDEPFILDRLL